MDPADHSLSSLTESVTALKCQITQGNTKFQAWKTRIEEQKIKERTELNCDCDCEEVVKDFGQGVEDMIASLLLVVQTLKKASDGNGEKEKQENGTVFLWKYHMYMYL